MVDKHGKTTIFYVLNNFCRNSINYYQRQLVTICIEIDLHTPLWNYSVVLGCSLMYWILCAWIVQKEAGIPKKAIKVEDIPGLSKFFNNLWSLWVSKFSVEINTLLVLLITAIGLPNHLASITLFFFHDWLLNCFSSPCYFMRSLWA